MFHALIKGRKYGSFGSNTLFLRPNAVRKKGPWLWFVKMMILQDPFRNRKQSAQFWSKLCIQPYGKRLDERKRHWIATGRKSYLMFWESLRILHGCQGGSHERYKKGDINAKKDIISNARGYTQLLSYHIPKEDDVLYPLADQVLKASDQVELLGRFEEIERDRIGEDKHHEYIHLVEKLEKELKIRLD